MLYLKILLIIYLLFIGYSNLPIKLAWQVLTIAICTSIILQALDIIYRKLK